MMANARNRFKPNAWNMAACVVMRLVKNAKRSFIVSGGMASAPRFPWVNGDPPGLRHAVGEHARAWVTGLRVQHGLFLRHELNVIVDGCGLGVAFPLGLDDLLFCQCNQQLVGVPAIAQSEYVGSV